MKNSLTLQVTLHAVCGFFLLVGNAAAQGPGPSRTIATGPRDTSIAGGTRLQMPPLPSAPKATLVNNAENGIQYQDRGVIMTRKSGDPIVTVWNSNQYAKATITLRFQKAGSDGFWLKTFTLNGGATGTFDKNVLRNATLKTVVLDWQERPVKPAPTIQPKASSNASNSAILAALGIKSTSKVPAGLPYLQGEWNAMTASEKNAAMKAWKQG